MRKLATVLLLLLSSCASSPEQREETGPEAGAEARDQAPTPAPQALLDCLDVLGEEHESELARARAATTTCGRLWSRPQCSKAWETSLSLAPGERAPHIMSACASAYCAELRPSPDLCEHDASQADLIDDQTDWLEMWTLFNRSALADTLGEENVLEAAHFARTLMLLVSMTKGRSDGS